MEDIDDLILNVVDYITKEWCRSIVVNKFENINFDKRKRKSHLLLQVYLGENVYLKCKYYKNNHLSLIYWYTFVVIMPNLLKKINNRVLFGDIFI